MDTSSYVLQNLADIATNLPFPVFWTNLESKVLGANQAYLNAAGVQHRDRVIGKTPHDYLPKELADSAVVQTELVGKNKEAKSREETIRDNISGKSRYWTTFASPVANGQGQTIAILNTSFETTKEKENRNQLLRSILQDLNSPLASIKIILTICHELPANKRKVIEEAVARASSIIANLPGMHKTNGSPTSADSDRSDLLLVSDQLRQIVNQRKNQLKNFLITFETEISDEAHFVFAKIPPTQFNQVITNLLNNAVDSFIQNVGGTITIHLDADGETIKLSIQDTGKGLSPAQLDKFRARQKFEDNPESVSHMRMIQAWHILDQNHLKLTIESKLNKGTKVELTFPRISTCAWIVREIGIHPQNIILILEDDDLLQSAWNERFQPYLKRYPALSLRHFTIGESLLRFLETLSEQEKERVMFLCDYELLNQDRNGLQIIEDSKLPTATLVTSYYENLTVQDTAARLGVKIIPKPMISLLPILCKSNQECN